MTSFKTNQIQVTDLVDRVPIWYENAFLVTREWTSSSTGCRTLKRKAKRSAAEAAPTRRSRLWAGWGGGFCISPLFFSIHRSRGRTASDYYSPDKSSFDLSWSPAPVVDGRKPPLNCFFSSKKSDPLGEARERRTCHCARSEGNRTLISSVGWFERRPQRLMQSADARSWNRNETRSLDRVKRTNSRQSRPMRRPPPPPPHRQSSPWTAQVRPEAVERVAVEPQAVAASWRCFLFVVVVVFSFLTFPYFGRPGLFILSTAAAVLPQSATTAEAAQVCVCVFECVPSL